MLADKNICRLIKNDIVQAEANRVGQLFVLNMVIDTNEMAAITKSKVDLEVWHKRLAHQNIKKIKEILTKLNIEFFDDERSP